MKPFRFSPALASGGEHLDRIKGLPTRPTGWTFKDLQAAALQHATVCGEARTAAIAKSVMGALDHPVDPKHYSELIAHYVYEITKRPYVLAAARAEQQRKPYA